MYLIAHETMEEALASSSVLKGLGSAARRLLAESVEHSGVTRKQVSAAAASLESSGFLFIRDKGFVGSPEFELMPSLAGEEALEALEDMEEKAKPRR